MCIIKLSAPSIYIVVKNHSQTQPQASSSRWQITHSTDQRRPAHLPPTFSTQLEISERVLHLQTRYRTQSTPPWAIVNIICIISISWCSYRDQRSVRGQAGVHGMLQHAVRSTEYCNISALLKCKYHVLRAKESQCRFIHEEGDLCGRECSESSQPSPSVRVTSLPWSPTTQIPPC